MALWLKRALRWVLGGWFLFAAGLFFAARLGATVSLPSDGGEQAAAFMTALRDTGFISPLMYVCFFAGGLATLFDRTAPLGLVILAPFVVVIFFYHLILTGNWSWGALWAAMLVILLWLYRERFAALWTRPA